MNSLETLINIASNQYSLNEKINVEWITAAQQETQDFRLASSQELAEMVESYTYNWWSKSQKQDIQNVLTEIVDAMHFMLSHHISEVSKVSSGPQDTFSVVANRIYTRYVAASKLQKIDDPVKVRHLIRELIASVNIGGPADYWAAFFALTQALGFSLDHILARYLAKNILNVFRQDNGYKQGTYQKMWSGKEDNWYVANRIDQQFQANNDFDVEDFRAWLQQEYTKHKNAELVKTEELEKPKQQQPVVPHTNQKNPSRS